MHIIFTQNPELINIAKQKGEQIIQLDNCNLNNSTTSTEPIIVDVSKTIYQQDFQEIENAITEVFIHLGIPSHVKGFYFLRFAIVQLLTNPTFDENGLTKGIYPNVAKHFNTTAAKVERAMRHAIEIAYNKRNSKFSKEIFSPYVNLSKKKPTNAEFLYGVKIYLEKISYED